jgi:disulfide oxidoreductase YuzD
MKLWQNEFSTLDSNYFLAIIKDLEIKLELANIDASRYVELKTDPILHYDISLHENDDGDLTFPMLVIGDNCIYNGNMRKSIDNYIDERIAMRKNYVQEELDNKQNI